MLRLFASLLVWFLLASCGDTIIESNESTAIAKGNLFVSATDAVSGNPLPNVEFFMPAMDSKPRETSGLNGTVYKGLPIGENYAVRVSAKGYAPVVCNASIRLAENQDRQSISVAENTTLRVSLRRLSASLRGSIFYQNLEKPLQLEVFPASGAQVSVIIQDNADCSYEQRIFGPASVSKDGFYSFDSLPEKAYCTLVAHDAHLNGLLYSGMQSEGALEVSGNAAIMPRLVYDVVQTAFGFVFSSDNRSVAKKNDVLKFGFSEPVNVSLLRDGDLSASNNATKVSVAANFSWSDSNKTLTVAPAFGEWASGQSYDIRMRLYSAVSSKIIDTTLVFSVNEFLDFGSQSVRGIHLAGVVNHNTNSVIVRWNGLIGAEAYEIYVKASLKFESIYSFAGEVTRRTQDVVDTAFTLPTPNWFLNGDSALVLVAARNGKGKSSFGEPFVIKDNVRPYFSVTPNAIPPDTANYVINATNSFNSVMTESEFSTNVIFNEPMDTTVVLTATIPSQTPRELKVEWGWTNETTLKVSFKIGAGALNESESPLAIPISISGFIDKAGNSVRASSVGTRNWEGLLMVLHADAASK